MKNLFQIIENNLVYTLSVFAIIASFSAIVGYIINSSVNDKRIMLCEEVLEGKLLRNQGWNTIGLGEAASIGILVKDNKAELLFNHGEAPTLVCFYSRFPEKKITAYQRWFKHK